MSTIDISTTILQYIPPGVFGIENICLIHDHCGHLCDYITAYSPRGYDVNSQAYWKASYQWHRGNLTKLISGLKHPALFYSHCHPLHLAHKYPHFTYRVLTPDTAYDLDFIIEAFPDNCQWSRYQRDLVANIKLYSRHVKHAALCKHTCGPHKGYCNLGI